MNCIVAKAVAGGPLYNVTLGCCPRLKVRRTNISATASQTCCTITTLNKYTFSCASASLPCTTKPSPTASVADFKCSHIRWTANITKQAVEKHSSPDYRRRQKSILNLAN